MADRVVVVTGASSGIGAALAEILCARGDTVVLVARRQQKLEEAASRCGGRGHPMTADVTKRDDVRRVVRATLADFGEIDVWVNNAGQGISRLPSQLTDEDVDEMMRVNVKSALYGMQEVLPHFIARGSGQFVNVSSMLGRIPFVPARAAYNAAKHYLNALTANFRDEVQQAHPGIVFSIVSPGVVRTDFGLNARHGGPDSRQLPHSQGPEQVAEIIAGVIDSRRPDVYTVPGSSQRVADYYARIGEDG
jgi:NAD(P)-dependent dehydrogenase (short-subunit alcohol dehydrogenase family)